MSNRDFKSLLQHYNRELFENILPFWMENGIDWENGGFFTCFSNDGSKKLFNHKFTWSQGRFVWMLARLYRQFEGKRPESERKKWLEAAKAGAEFLMKYSRLENGNCAFILNEKGKPILLDENGNERDVKPGEPLDLSIYADGFLIYGLAEYARAAHDIEVARFTLDQYKNNYLKRFTSGNYLSAPYPTPKGYDKHGRPMFMLEIAQELADCIDELGMTDEADELRRFANECVGQIMNTFRQTPDNIILEFMGTDGKPKDNILGRYINPGHTIEDMWFVMHRGLATGNKQLIGNCAAITKSVLERAWDNEFGGIPLFQDRDGGKPKGDIPEELAGEVMIQKITDDWASKLWWVHSEALYTLLLTYEQTGEDWALEWYDKVHDYTFSTFPNPDKSVGEWIQIRNREGKPENRIVALPVKDPFHVTRALAHSIRVLEKLAG